MPINENDFTETIRSNLGHQLQRSPGLRRASVERIEADERIDSSLLLSFTRDVAYDFRS